MSAPTPVLSLQRGSDGVWEALVVEIHGSNDIEVRDDLASLRATSAPVRVAGELKSLTVFETPDGSAVVRYADALPE